jgi:integrase/recombinase XerD
MLENSAGFNWVLSPRKFLCLDEAKKLRETARIRASIAIACNRKVAVRDYFVIDVALSTGLRVMEISRLNCGDIFMGNGMSSLFVKKGKCGKKRLVRCGETFIRSFNKYIDWKKAIGEPTGIDDPLFLSNSSGRYLTTRALQKCFKRIAEEAGLPAYYLIHCLRHTYACQLYKASNYNLRLVQKQLGHSSIRTTEVYADVIEPDVQDALKRLYK